MSVIGKHCLELKQDLRASSVELSRRLLFLGIHGQLFCEDSKSQRVRLHLHASCTNQGHASADPWSQHRSRGSIVAECPCASLSLHPESLLLLETVLD